MKPKDGATMIASTGPSTEVLLEPPAQVGFRSGTDSMGADSDHSPNSRLPGLEFTGFAEEIDSPFRQRRAPDKFAERSALPWRIGETRDE
jgi:hypothetical protein